MQYHLQKGKILHLDLICIASYIVDVSKTEGAPVHVLYTCVHNSLMELHNQVFGLKSMADFDTL